MRAKLNHLVLVRRAAIQFLRGFEHHARRMMRLRNEQGRLFYSFCLEDVVPGDHLLRGIAAILNLSWVHGELASYYAKIGRPSIDPDAHHRLCVWHSLGTAAVP